VEKILIKIYEEMASPFLHIFLLKFSPLCYNFSMKKNIYLATDHAGFEYKEKVKKILEKKFSENFEIFDCGAENFNKNDDYPDFISIAAKKVSENFENSLGIIFGGSGQGEAMVANKYKNIRTTVFYGGDMEILKLSKNHNNANILSIGARFIPEKNLEQIIST
jgi:ribose 5-phosphate isomerase B